MPRTRSVLAELPTVTGSGSPRRRLQRLRGRAAQVNAVGGEKLEHAIADIADERGLQGRRLKGIEAQHLERVVPPGKRDLEFQHGAQIAYGRVARQIHEHLLRKAFARTADDDIGLADQPFGGQSKFVERGAVDQKDRRAERDAERKGEHSHQKPRGLLA